MPHVHQTHGISQQPAQQPTHSYHQPAQQPTYSPQQPVQQPIYSGPHAQVAPTPVFFQPPQHHARRHRDFERAPLLSLCCPFIRR